MEFDILTLTFRNYQYHFHPSQDKGFSHCLMFVFTILGRECCTFVFYSFFVYSVTFIVHEVLVLGIIWSLRVHSLFMIGIRICSKLFSFLLSVGFSAFYLNILRRRVSELCYDRQDLLNAQSFPGSDMLLIIKLLSLPTAFHPSVTLLFYFYCLH